MSTIASSTAVAKDLLALETAALKRWGQGDPSGFLEISAPHPFVAQRINGHAALSQYYETIRGQVHIDTFEIIDPRVSETGEMAVLSFNFASSSGNNHYHWNCSEVYRRTAGQWHIVQTHWSMIKPVQSTTESAA